MAVKYFGKFFLKDKLKKHVGTDVFGRGVRYFNQELVGKVKVASGKNPTQIKISALVSGSDVYSTTIIFSLNTGNFGDLSCDCPYDWGACKHCIALGLKFIELYGDFTSETDLEFDLASEFVLAFQGWLKNASGNEKEDWEDDFENEDDDERDEDLKYEYENGAEKSEKIKDAEIVSELFPQSPEDIAKRNEIDDNVKLKELLKSIGLDAEKMPDYVLKYLKVSQKSDEIKKEIVKKKFKKTFTEKYYFLISYEYAFEVRIAENSNRGYFWNRPDPKIIRGNENDILTEEQKELLTLLETAGRWDQNTDWGRIFSLIKMSGAKAYFEHRDYGNEIKFGVATEKVKVKLSFRNEKYFPTGFSDHLDLPKFSVELFGNFGTIRKPKLLAGKDNLILIENNYVNFHKSDPVLFEIFSQIPEEPKKYYDYEKNEWKIDSEWKTNLSENSIIRINEVILALKNNFDLETELLPDFEVVKFEKPKPIVLVDYDAEQNNLKVSLAMDYGFDKVDIAFTSRRRVSGGKILFETRWDLLKKEFHIKVEGQKIYYAPFDFEKEKEIFKEFEGKTKFGFPLQLRLKKNGQKQIAQYVKEYWPEMKNCGYPVVFLKDELAEFVEADFKADFKVDFDAENDWLAFDFKCYCGENKITLEDLKKYVENKEQFFRINGKMTKIANREELERFIKMLESFHQKEGQKFEGKIYHAPELEDFIGSIYYTSKISESFKKFMAEAQSGRPVEKVKIPAGIKRILRDYQEDGISWFYFLRKYRFGGILADDMGLGKTVQALSLMQMNKVKNKPSLVLCPKTLLFNWQDEAEKFFPEMKTLIIEGAPKDRQERIKKIKKFDLIITSYSALKKDPETYEKKNLKFNYCLIDEAQFIKNHKTQNAQAVKKVNADYRLALTGTPMENSVAEIWSIFDFLMPGFLGKNKSFVEKFQTPIMKNNNLPALKMLRKKISCFMLRRTKDKVLKELPPKIEQVSHCELGAHQNILYQEILANVKSEIFETVKQKGFAGSQIHILAGLTKLRQVCNHPVLLLKDKNHKKYQSAKMDLLFELVDEIVSSNRKVLIFSQFTQMLDILAKELDERKIGHNYLSGKTKNRKELVQDFNKNESKKVFLISLKAGGTGLNLVGADNVIIFDPWWNPSVENQAIDRAHRIGQQKSVNVYKLISKGTIEERILKLQEKKKALFDGLVGESNNLFQKLTWEDVKELFR